MALLYMDSFDDGLFTSSVNYKGWQAASRPTPSGTYGRNGNGVRIGDSANTYLQRSGLNASGDTIIVGLATYIQGHGANTGEYLLAFYDTAGLINGYVDVHTDGSIHYVNGDGQNQGSSATSAVPTQTWCYIEVKVKFNATTGTVDIRVNESSVLSVTSKDTIDNSGLADCGKVQYTSTSGGSLHDVYIDDIYILDGSGSAPYNDFLGDIQVECLLPNGNGNSSGMTGSDSNQTDNYLLVDDDPVDTADYVESATEGHKDTYTMENLASTNVTVRGVQVSVVAQKDNTGSKYLRPVVRSGSTDYNGTSVALNTSWEGQREIWEQDPNTSLDWTAANVNAVEVGQEVRDS